MSDLLKGQSMPEGVVSEIADAPQDVVDEAEAPDGSTLHVMVMRVARGGGGYLRLAHWQVIEGQAEPVLHPDTHQNVPLARSIVGRLLKHLRGGPEL